MTIDLQMLVTNAEAVFPQGSPEATVCAYVFEQLEHLRDGFDSITPHAIANALRWKDDPARRRAIVRALDFLACGQEPLLERRFQLWAPDASDEILEDPLCFLSDSDMRAAVEQDTLINPETGEEVPDFLHHVTIIYVVTDLAKRDSLAGLAAG